MMTLDDLVALFKYYKKEDTCPFERNSVQALWWSGEKTLYEKVSYDDSFFDRLSSSLTKCLAEGHCSGKLIDDSISFNERAVIFYLDLWHGKNFPYDDLDLINEY